MFMHHKCQVGYLYPMKTTRIFISNEDDKDTLYSNDDDYDTFVS